MKIFELLKKVYRFNAISIEIPMSLSTKKEENIKISMETQRSQIVK